VHVAQLTIVDKSTETEWLMVLSLRNARQETIYREAIYFISVIRQSTRG
jgi:hypothetical protein